MYLYTKEALMIYLILIDSTLFIILSFLHIYWALGGNWGMNAVLPDITHNDKTIKPGFFMTMAVAIVMGAFALIIMGNMGIFGDYLTHHFFKYGTIVIAAIFVLRAMGDFRYVGFFKKATDTLFAKNDTRYYSPLCVLIAVLSFTIALLN